MSKNQCICRAERIAFYPLSRIDYPERILELPDIRQKRRQQQVPLPQEGQRVMSSPLRTSIISGMVFCVFS